MDVSDDELCLQSFPFLVYHAEVLVLGIEIGGSKQVQTQSRMGHPGGDSLQTAWVNEG